MPVTNDIAVLAHMREWTDGQGTRRRHSRHTSRPMAFDQADAEGVWSPSATPGPRPWEAVAIVRTPATLRECFAGAPAGRRYRRSSSLLKRSYTQSRDDLRLSSDDVEATDWTYSDGGDTWVSPND